MIYTKHILFDVLAGLLQLLPKIIALIVISRMSVNIGMERLRKISIYTITFTLIVSIISPIVLNIYDSYSRDIFIVIQRSTDFIFIVILGYFIYNVIKYRDGKKYNSND
ncbi:hypothetical protein [Fusibacter ferrireducens]|uniref:Uncharacterized protein n=1 Tax=Fusibacter ferrireducens TaxID=2785058 RepID=A0ABR9ZPE2_9FIRM|nr:hypothetical protein [Fusibacter ferrireducens]MBF4691489.1 hypothetical protein [Fusibacter ferrireducens]